MTLASLALWALVVALGLQSGAGIYETRVIVPLWASNPPASVLAFFGQPLRPDSGRRFWIILSPITTLITLANLVLALLLHTPNRTWWLAASGGALAVMIATFAYFVPVLLKLQRAAELPPVQVAGMVKSWVCLNYVRAVVIVASWLAALAAFSR